MMGFSTSFKTALFILPVMAYANQCRDERKAVPPDLNSLLPREIGSEKAEGIQPYQALCDTLYVPSGDTTLIHAGTLFHFSRPEFGNRIIMVQGCLRILGKTDLPVSLAGDLFTARSVSEAGSGKWGGIRVESSGSLEIRNALFTGADTALDLRSLSVRLTQVQFEGCKIWLDPERFFHVLDPEETLSEKVWAGRGAGREAKSNWKKPGAYWWVGELAGATALSFLIAYSIPLKHEGPSKPTSKPFEFDPIPELPPVPKPIE